MADDFLRMSQEALATGDRDAALIAALRAIPADPTEADLERFGPSFDALHRVAASRAIRLPLEVESYASFGPRGERVATIGMMPLDEAQPEFGEPLKIWDAMSGALMSAPLDLAATTSIGVGPPVPRFSPDGQYVAIVANQTGEVVVLDAASGEVLWRNAAYVPDEISFGVTFSGDSRMLLTTGGDPFEVTVWDADSGTKLYSAADGRGCFYFPVQEAPGASVYFIAERYRDFCDAPRRLVRFDGSTVQDLADLSDLGSLSLDMGPRMDPTEERVLLVTESFGTIVVTLDGTVVADIPAAVSGGELTEFARGGAALAGMAAHGGGPGSVLIFDFEGNPLSVEADDLLAFGHAVYTPNGAVIGWPELAGADYVGANLPRGVALYEELWSGLPDAARAAVEADRVIRP